MSGQSVVKTCEKGHRYHRSSECPVCPVCDQARKPEYGFFSGLSAPARRALEHVGITTVYQLSNCSENEILSLHGMGQATLSKLRIALEVHNLTFRIDPQTSK